MGGAAGGDRTLPVHRGRAVTAGLRLVAPAGPDVLAGDEPAGRSPGAVGKALQLLEAFMVTGPVAGVTELARTAGLSKSTAFRLLASLEEAGYVTHAGSDYCLNLRLFELGSQVAVCRPDGLRAVAAPFLADLFRETAHAAHLAVLDGTDVLYIEKVHGSGTPRVPTSVGSRMPASCTALGKAMLSAGHEATVSRLIADGLPRRTRHSVAAPGLLVAELRRARAAGVAFDREESMLGLTCVAAPVCHAGRAIAAISLSGPTRRLDPERLSAKLQAVAAQIAARHAALRPDGILPARAR